MSLSKVIEEIKQVKTFAEENVEAGPVETLNARRGRKNQAIERLKALKREYRRSMLDTAVFIIVTGDKREEFAEASKKFECFSADPNEVFSDLASRIPPGLYLGNSTVSNTFDVLGRHLEDKANELDIIGYPQLLFKQEYRMVLKDKNDLTDLIRRAMNEQVGPEIVGIQAVSSLLNTAIDAGHTGRITPIVLATNDEKFALDLDRALDRLKPKGVFLVIAGKGSKTLRAVEGAITVKDPSTENVEAALKNISNATKR